MSLTRPVTVRDHQRGPSDALVTVVEYGDFECPYCARAHPILQELQRRFGANLRVVFRHFPLREVHRHARRAAEAAECVATHGGEEAFWRMHDALFAHQQDSALALSDERLAAYASAAGVAGELVTRDLATGAHVERVREDFESGVRSGVNGTPTFYINGERYDGDWTDVDRFAAMLGRAARERRRAVRAH